jgi:hypothetical protein
MLVIDFAASEEKAKNDIGDQVSRTILFYRRSLGNEY